MIFADAFVSSDTPVVVGAFVTITGAFLGIAKLMLNQATKDRDADRAERLKLSDAITLMAENNGKIAVATEKGAHEAKERNGHIAEISTKSLEIATKTLERLEKTATIAASAAGDGGLLVRTKKNDPLEIKVKK